MKCPKCSKDIVYEGAESEFAGSHTFVYYYCENCNVMYSRTCEMKEWPSEIKKIRKKKAKKEEKNIFERLGDAL